MRSHFVLIAALAVLLAPETTLAQPDELGLWLSRAPLPTPRQEMPQVFLNNRIYIPGGLLQNTLATTIVEVFEPAANRWTAAANLPAAMHHLHLTTANLRLYVLGGFEGSGFTPSNLVFEYNPSNNEWTQLATMPTPRGAGVAAALDGKIFVIGGVSSFQLAVGTNEMFDPVANTWNSRRAMPTRREHLAAAVIDSLIYVVGGREFGVNKNTLEAYSPRSDTWYTLAPMPTARGGLAAAALHGRLYVFGGEFFDSGGSGVFAEVEEYNPVTNTWRELTPMPVPRHGMGAAAVGDSIFVIGGGPVAGFGVSNVNSLFVPPAIPSAVIDAPQRPEPFILLQNYPNPFNPATTIRITLAHESEVVLNIFDVTGRVVTTLLSQKMPKGEHSVEWNAHPQASGVYVGTLWAGSRLIATRKMLLLR